MSYEQVGFIAMSMQQSSDSDMKNIFVKKLTHAVLFLQFHWDVH